MDTDKNKQKKYIQQGMYKKRCIKKQLGNVVIKAQDLVKQTGGKMFYW